jgi:hypothetical protein
MTPLRCSLLVGRSHPSSDGILLYAHTGASKVVESEDEWEATVAVDWAMEAVETETDSDREAGDLGQDPDSDDKTIDSCFSSGDPSSWLQYNNGSLRGGLGGSLESSLFGVR